VNDDIEDMNGYTALLLQIYPGGPLGLAGQDYAFFQHDEMGKDQDDWGRFMYFQTNLIKS
jgi:hypothetical protein